MTKRTETISEQKVMSKVEADNIKAKTRLLNHTNIKQWIFTIIGVILGVTIILIGLVKFLNNDNNYYYIALMTVGIFIMSGITPKLNNIIENIQP